MPPQVAAPEVEAVRAVFRCKRAHCKCKSGEQVHCPGWPQHKNADRNPSLAVNAGKRQPVVLNCFVCEDRSAMISAAIDALRHAGLDLNGRPLGTRTNASTSATPPSSTDTGVRRQRFHYRDASGALVCVKERVTYPSRKKAFVCRLPDGTPSQGQIHWRDVPLYQLGTLLNEQRCCSESGELMPWILFVEGEKCALRAYKRHGWLAVSLPGGSDQHDFGAALEPLAGECVVLLPDNDGPGIRLMNRVGDALQEIAEEVRWVQPPGLPPKGDLIDFFELGYTDDDLEQLIDEAPIYDPSLAAQWNRTRRRSRGPRKPRALTGQEQLALMERIAAGSQTYPEIFAGLGGHKGDWLFWLSHSTEIGQLDRTGSGHRGDAFRHTLTPIGQAWLEQARALESARTSLAQVNEANAV